MCDWHPEAVPSGVDAVGTNNCVCHEMGCAATEETEMRVIEARLKDPAGCVCEPSAADLYLEDGTCPLGLNAEGQECVCFDQCVDLVSEQIVLQEVAAEEP